MLEMATLTEEAKQRGRQRIPKYVATNPSTITVTLCETARRLQGILVGTCEAQSGVNRRKTLSDPINLSTGIVWKY
ncbi:hypothetical protein GJAV_G00041040 [Gymnothorax javanicus]|nr:hypothetical protein GJAV_G00041040 [Gymnothorax javanicus]